MRRVYRTTDKEIDIGRFFKQHAGDHGRAVALIAPLAVLAVFLKVILRVLDDLAHGDDAFGDKVESFDLRRGRNIGIEVIELCDDGLFEVFRRKRRRGTAADNPLAGCREERLVHFREIFGFRRRSDHQVHAAALAHFDADRGGIVARLAAVELVALIEQQRIERFCREAFVVHHLHIVDNVLALPAEIQRHADAGMNGAVAERNERVILLNRDAGLIDRFAADLDGFARVFPVFAVAQQNHERVIILNDLRFFIFYDSDDGERGIRHAAHRADGQCRRNGLHAVFDMQPLRHHGRDDLCGQRGKNICLNTAAHAVCQHNHRGIFSLRNDVNVIAAKLFTFFVEAHPANISTEIIHLAAIPLT